MMPDLTELERVLDAEVVPSGSPAFRELRNRSTPVRHRGAAGGRAVRFRRRRHRDDRLHPPAWPSRRDEGGGHDFAGRSTTPGILIDVSPMRAVTVADGTIRIGARAVDASWSEAHPWRTGGVFPTSPTPSPTIENAYHGSNFEELCRIKARYDPDDVFRFSQPLPLR